MSTAPTVVVLAAGKGTRMRSQVPKVLHQLCGRPLVQWPIAVARELGARRIVVVDGPGRPLADHLGDDLLVAVQEQLDGTAGAVAAALAHLTGAAPADGVAGEPVVVLNGDGPLVPAAAVAALVEGLAGGGVAGAVLTTLLDDPSGYGRIVRDGDGDVVRIVETKSPGDASADELEIAEINTGVMAFAPDALRVALPRVGTGNAQGERYLTDVLALLREDGHRVVAHRHDDAAVVLGVNDRHDLSIVRDEAQRRIIAEHQRAGVDVLQPASTVIDVGVEIGPDTVIEPGCVIRGATTIGAGATIGAYTVLEHASVGDGATIRRSHVELADVGPGVSVGPFAYLRPGTTLRAGSKVGTFVELKNSDVGEGAKVPHLSYVGDADVGARTNLGAGTITANYDGHAKHRTVVGEDVHGGVHVSLVAPIALGDHAWTAAGSTLTEDVPPGALGIARPRQEVREGYDERLAARRDATG